MEIPFSRNNTILVGTASWMGGCPDIDKSTRNRFRATWSPENLVHYLLDFLVYLFLRTWQRKWTQNACQYKEKCWLWRGDSCLWPQSGNFNRCGWIPWQQVMSSSKGMLEKWWNHFCWRFDSLSDNYIMGLGQAGVSINSAGNDVEKWV